MLTMELEELKLEDIFLSLTDGEEPTEDESTEEAAPEEESEEEEKEDDAE